MIFIHRIPRPPLDAFVASIWFCENEPRPWALERILPTGAAQLIVNLKEDETRSYLPELGYRCETAAGSVLAGVQSRFSLIDTAEQECVAGVAFLPGGMGPFFPVPASETLNSDVPLDVLWGRQRVSRLRQQLLEATGPQAKLDVLESALADIWSPSGLHPAVNYALKTFTRQPLPGKIRGVTDSIGMSPKRFIERFKSAVGMSPKHYCRVLRFQHALACANGGGFVDWTGVAVDCGYYDQAHFIHDFREFAGLTPTGYQARRTPFQNHVKFLQSDVESL